MIELALILVSAFFFVFASIAVLYFARTTWEAQKRQAEITRLVLDRPATAGTSQVVYVPQPMLAAPPLVHNADETLVGETEDEDGAPRLVRVPLGSFPSAGVNHNGQPFAPLHDDENALSG